MKIREAQVADISRLLELENYFLAPFKEKDVLYELEGNPVSNYYVYEEDDKILGFIDFWITFDSATICQIAVDENYRRKGIAEELLKFSFEELKKAEVLTYTLEVRDHNIAAINLYKKLGFEEICVKPKYYDNGDNAIYMMKGMI